MATKVPKPVARKIDTLMEWALVTISAAFVVFVAILVYRNSKTQTLTIAAGSSTGESFIICEALRTVVERHNPALRLNLRQTGGTVESLRLLETGEAQLAAAQADVAPGPSARMVALLYDDTVQLLTRRDSPVKNFTDLAGRTIGLPRTGGQFQTFLRIADHFGLHESDFRFTGATDAESDEAFIDSQADAVFRVRALGSPAIQKLVHSGQVRIVGIGQGAAMKIYQPAFDPAVIPIAAYRGNPAVPEEDLPSISVHRQLLASSAADEEAVRLVTATLIERRQEIALEIPEDAADVRLLIAHIRKPDALSGAEPALYPGSLQYYEKDKPPFVLAHADYMGLILTVAVMIGSWIWELRSWLQRQQKNVADQYSSRVVALMNEARTAPDPAHLETIRGELLSIFSRAVADLDADRLSGDSFDSFRAILRIGLEEVRDSRALLSQVPR